MRPVFEHALVDALGLTQIRAPVIRDAGPENMVVGALDDVDGVDLDVAEMLYRGRRRLRSLPERRRDIEPLGAQPDPPGFRLGQGMGFDGAGHGAANLAGFAPWMPRIRKSRAHPSRSEEHTSELQSRGHL